MPEEPTTRLPVRHRGGGSSAGKFEPQGGGAPTRRWSGIASLTGVGLLVIFMIQNTESVQLDFLVWGFTWPLGSSPWLPRFLGRWCGSDWACCGVTAPQGTPPRPARLNRPMPSPREADSRTRERESAFNRPLRPPSQRARMVGRAGAHRLGVSAGTYRRSSRTRSLEWETWYRICRTFGWPHDRAWLIRSTRTPLSARRALLSEGSDGLELS